MTYFTVWHHFQSDERKRNLGSGIYLRSGCSGMAMRSHSMFTLYWLLTLDVRLPNGCRGIVPITSGSSRESLDVPGTSTHTYENKKQSLVKSIKSSVKSSVAWRSNKLTLSIYSTLMMRHCRMEGPTGGILMARPCQVSLRCGPTMSPHNVATTARFCFMVPLAMKVCVWVMKAFGTTEREVELSNSAKTGITSPGE